MPTDQVPTIIPNYEQTQSASLDNNEIETIRADEPITEHFTQNKLHELLTDQEVQTEVNSNKSASNLIDKTDIPANTHDVDSAADPDTRSADLKETEFIRQIVEEHNK